MPQEDAELMAEARHRIDLAFASIWLLCRMQFNDNWRWCSKTCKARFQSFKQRQRRSYGLAITKRCRITG